MKNLKRIKKNSPGFTHCHDGNVGKNEWLTPPELIKSLGEFDLDPCSPINRPWPTARNHFTIVDNGFLREWVDRVWLNPPYNKGEIGLWMEKMGMHNNGIALLFARTDTDAFHNYIFPVADSILFIKQRLTFYNVDGTIAGSNAGAPSILIGYGEGNSEALAESKITGKHILINRVAVVVLGIDHTWKTIVKTALVNLNNEATLESLYKEIESIAPEKIEKNQHYKEKIRQQLQLHFSRVKKGHYKVAA